MLSMPLPTMMKQVRFAEPSDEDVCYFEKDENRRENWYTKKEYQCFMIESSATKKKIERRSELISFLEDAHQHCLSLSGSLTDIYDEEDALADMCYHKNLMRWTGYEQVDCRGLEKASSSVIKFYSGLSKEVKTKLLSMIKVNQCDEDEIRDLFAYSSRRARLFARLTAECDAQLVLQNDVASKQTLDEPNKSSSLATKLFIPVSFLVKHRSSNRPAAA